MIRKLTILCFALATLAGAATYHTSYEVQDQEAKLRLLEREIAETKEGIQVLEAEISFLSSPERIARLAETHLLLFPTEAKQLTTIANLPQQASDLDRMVDVALVTPLPGAKPSARPATQIAQSNQTITSIYRSSSAARVQLEQSE